MEINEYRCRNSFCIPKQFWKDDSTNPDCLDGTNEEEEDHSYLNFCQKNPTLRCEELSCRLGEHHF
jgi:hypothetical protein